MLAALREHPEWRNAIRRELLTEDLLELPAKFERAERERREDARKVWEAIRGLTESQQRTDATLQAFMEATDKRFAEVEGRLDSLESTLRSFMEATEKQFVALENRLNAFIESTEKRFAEVEKRLDSLESTLRSSMEATDKRFVALENRLNAFIETTEERFLALESTLNGFIETTEKRFVAVERELAGMNIKLDELDGKVTERDAVEKLDNYLYKQIDPLEVLERRLLSRLFAAATRSGAITEEEREQLGDADALAVGEDKETGEPACAAVEVSTTVNPEDVERADLRSKLFLKALRAAVEAKPKQWEKLLASPPARTYGLVIGRRITEEARREAERRGVRFAKYRNGYDRRGQ